MLVPYPLAKAAQAILEKAVSDTSARLQAFPRGPLGITPDDVKVTPEYRAAKQAYNTAFAKLREFNAKFVPAYAKEIKAERTKRFDVA